MTVSELISLLQAEDPECEVAIGYEGTWTHFDQIYRFDEDSKYGKLVVVAAP